MTPPTFTAPRLEDVLTHDSFITAGNDQKLTMLDETFRLYEPMAQSTEDHENLFKVKTGLQEKIYTDQFHESAKGSLSPDLQTPENIDFLGQHLQKYWKDSRGKSAEPMGTPLLRLNRLTDDEVTELTQSYRIGGKMPLLLPSEMARVKQQFDNEEYEYTASGGGNAIRDEIMRSLQEKGAGPFGEVSAYESFGRNTELETRAAPAFEALKNFSSLNVRREQSNWTVESDGEGWLYNYRRKPSNDNTWQVMLNGMKTGDAPIEVPFDRELDFSNKDDVKTFTESMKNAIRKNYEKFDSTPNVESGSVGLGLSPRERAEKLFGLENRSFFGHAMDITQRHVTPIGVSSLSGLFHLLSLPEDYTVGKEGMELYGDFSFFGNAGQAWGQLADDMRATAPHTVEDMKVLENGWGLGWDASVIADKTVGMGAMMAQLLASRNAPMNGFAGITMQQVQASHSSLFQHALNLGYDYDKASSMARNGSALEGIIMGALIYGSGRLIVENKLASDTIRKSLVNWLGTASKELGGKKALNGWASKFTTNFAAALPGDITVNVGANQIARLSSAFIHDFVATESQEMQGIARQIEALKDDQSPEAQETLSQLRKQQQGRVGAFFDVEDWENFSKSEFGRGLLDDTIFSVFGAAIFGNMHPRGVDSLDLNDASIGPRGGGIQGGYPVWKTGNGFAVTVPESLTLRGDADPLGWSTMRFGDKNEATAFSQKVKLMEGLTQELFQAPSKGTTLKTTWKDGVTDVQKKAYQDLVSEIQSQVTAKNIAQSRPVTERGIETHDTLSDAVRAIKRLASEFVLGKGSPDEQRSNFVEKLMDRLTNSERDWAKERQSFIDNLGRPLDPPATPATEKRNQRISELEQEMMNSDKSTPQFRTTQEEHAKLVSEREKSRTTRQLTDSNKNAAADSFVASLRNTVRESMRGRAEAQAERVFGSEAPEVVDGVIQFNAGSEELASAISRNFTVKEQVVKNQDGTDRTVYEIQFGERTETTDAGGSARASAEVLARAPEAFTPSPPQSTRQIEAGRAERRGLLSAEQAGEQKAQQEQARQAEEAAALEAEQRGFVPAPPGTRRSAARDTVARVESHLTGRVGVAINEGGTRSARESAATIRQAGNQPVSATRQTELLRGSLNRVAAAADVLDALDSGETVSRRHINEASKSLTAEIKRVRENLVGSERDWLLGTLKNMQQGLKQKRESAPSTKPAEETVEAHVAKEIQAEVAPADAASVRQVIEDQIQGETGKNAAPLVDAVDVPTVVKKAAAEVKRAAQPKAEPKAKPEQKSKPNEKPAPAKEPETNPTVEAVVERATANAKAAKSGEPKPEAEWSQATKDAVAKQRQSNLPVGLTEQNKQRPYTEQDRADIARDLGYDSTDPVALARSLKDEFNPNAKSGTRKESVEEGQKRESEDLERILSKLPSGLTKKIKGDELFWEMEPTKEELDAVEREIEGADLSDEGLLGRQSTEQGGMKSNLKPGKRTTEGSTVIFSELADMAANGIKSGWNFAKFLAEATGRWGEAFKDAFKETWAAVTKAFASEVDNTPAENLPAIQREGFSSVLPDGHPLKDLAEQLDGTTAQQRMFVDSVLKAGQDAMRNGQLTEDQMKNLRESITGKAAKAFLNVTQPLWKSARDIHPDIGRALLKLEHFTLGLTKQFEEGSANLQNALRALNKHERLEFNRLAGSGNQVELQQFLSTRPKLADGWSDWTKLRVQIRDIARVNGLELGDLKDYFPRRVEDYGKLRDLLADSDFKGPIEDAIKLEEKRLNKTGLTDQEIADASRKIVDRSFHARGKNGNLKQRKIEVLSEKLVSMYKDPHITLEEYVSGMARDIGIARFLGAEPLAKMKSNPTGAFDPYQVIPASSAMGGILHDLVKRKVITAAQERDAIKLIATRLNYAPTHLWVRALKAGNVLFALNTPIRALTQLQELAFALHDNGILAMSAGIKPGIRMKDMGLQSSLALHQGDAIMPRIGDFIWKYAGFKALDAFSGNTYMNGHLNNLRKMSDAKRLEYIEPWRKFLKTSPEEVSESIKRGEYGTEDVSFLGFAQLSEIRPTSFSSMPAAYINNPGFGRLAYNLKLYAIHQLDALRDRAVQDYRKNGTLKSVANFTTLGSLLVLAGATIDETKDFILGRKVSFSNHVIDQTLKLALMSKYQNERLAKGDVLGTVAGLTLNTPIVSFTEMVIRDSNKIKKNVDAGIPWYEDFKQSRIFESVPFGGQAYHWWFSGAKGERQLDYLKSDYSERAQETISRYNALEKAGKEKRIRGGTEQEYRQLTDFNYIKQSIETLMKDSIEDYNTGEKGSALNEAFDMVEHLSSIAERPNTWKDERRFYERQMAARRQFIKKQKKAQ